MPDSISGNPCLQIPGGCRQSFKKQNACMNKSSSTRIKDAGIAIRHSRGYMISILQGPEMGRRGGHQGDKTANICITRQIRIQKMQPTREIRYQGGTKPLGRVPSPKTARKSSKNQNAGLGPPRQFYSSHVCEDSP